MLVVVLIPTPPACTWDSHLVLLLRMRCLVPLLQLLCPGAARQRRRGRAGPKAPSCAGRNGRPGCGCTCACRCVPAYGPRVRVRCWGLVCSHQYSRLGAMGLNPMRGASRSSGPAKRQASKPPGAPQLHMHMRSGARAGRGGLGGQPRDARLGEDRPIRGGPPD